MPKRHILSWNDFKKRDENLPTEKGKANDPEFSKRKSGKSDGGKETLDTAKKHNITNKDAKGKKGSTEVMDTPKKKTIKDESQLKDAKDKEILQPSNKGAEKKALPKVTTKGKKDLKYAKKKLKVKGTK